MPSLARTEGALRAFHASPGSASSSASAAETTTAAAATSHVAAVTASARQPPPRIPGAVMATNASKDSGGSNKSSSLAAVVTVAADGNRSPSPPPSASEVQLQLWLKVLRRRQAQVRRLASGRSSSFPFQSFVEDIVADMTSSRYHCQIVEEENGQQQQQQQHKTDLATGLYSSYLLTQSKQQQIEAHGEIATTTTANANAKISVEEIGNHFLALFYRSIDDRLPYVMRKHGLDSLRRIFQKLDLRLKEFHEANNEKEGIEVGGMRSRSGNDLGIKKRKTMDSSRGPLSSHGGKKRRTVSGGNISLQSDPDLAGNGLDTAREQTNELEFSASQGKKKRKTLDISTDESRIGSTSDSLQINLTNCADKNNTMTDMTSLKPTNRSEGFETAQLRKHGKSSNLEKQGNITDSNLEGNTDHCIRDQGTSDDMMPCNSTNITDKFSMEMGKVPHEIAKSGLEMATHFQQGINSDTATTTHANQSFRSQCGSANGTLNSRPYNNATRTENATPTLVVQETVTEEQHQEAVDLSPHTQQGCVGADVRNGSEIQQDTCNEDARVSGSMTEGYSISTEEGIGDNPYLDTTEHKQNVQLPIPTRATISPHIQNDSVHQKEQLVPDSMSTTPKRNALREKSSSGSTRENQLPDNSNKMTSIGEPSILIQQSLSSIHVPKVPPSNKLLTASWENNQHKVLPQSDEMNNKESECPKSDVSRNGTSETCHHLPLSHTLPQKSSAGNGGTVHAAVTLALNLPDNDDKVGSTNISRSSLDCSNTRQNCGLQTDTNGEVTVSPLNDANFEVGSLINNGDSQASASSADADAGSKETNSTQNAPCLSEVIDLTDDVDDDSDPFERSLQQPDALPASIPTKQDCDDGEISSNQKAQLDSPPASPVPFPILRNPPPLPLPNPTPFSDVRPIVFSADDPISSKSLSRRPKTTVMFNAGFQLDGSGSCLDDAHCIAVSERLKTWDPYWNIVEELGRRDVCFAGENGSSQREAKTTSVGTRTAPCVDPVRISQCASIYVDLPKYIANSESAARNSTGKSIPIRQMAWGVKWGKPAHPDKTAQLQTGDRRLLVRALPLERSGKDVLSRADCHIWPKGTFLEMKRGCNERVLSASIVQRAQQSHAPSEWKGMSHPLDLTYFVPSTDLPFELKLCAYEKVEKSSASERVLLGSYAIQVAICEYVSPDDLYDQLMGNTAESAVIIPTTSLKSATKMAKQYLLGQTVSIIDSDDEDNENRTEQDKSLTCSLLCSITKTVIQTPVRGRNCGHLQCFDLKNFLHANMSVSGGRWRCAVCEDFVSVRDLVRCGLFQSMIDSVGGKVTASQDRVLFHSDGTWRLLEPKSRSSASRKSEAVDEIIELI